MTLRKKRWKIALIHHSHTDIGYTERQEKIERFHIDFIKQAIKISEDIRTGIRKEWSGFHWTCESFWGVEKFLKETTSKWEERFLQAVKQGEIEITCNYLNLNELIDYDILKNMLRKSIDYAKSMGKKLDSAMTADINGYSWGYSQALVDVGVKNFFSCVHTHHGMYPLRKKQTPFWWETPKGDQLLVWLGDHYHTGNVLGFAPVTMSDENNHTFSCLSDNLEKEKKLIYDYLSELEMENYFYDIVPIMVSGLVTDNSPPNGHIMDFVNKWNYLYGDSVFVEMMTLSEFFQQIRKQDVKIPVYRGDWPDWWSDGLASTPGQTKIFREAQRTLRVVKELNREESIVDQTIIDNAEYDLMLYAEHTWGYSASVTEPWNNMVNTTGYRKDLYATRAHQNIFNSLDDLLRAKGEAELYAGRPMRYKVINPFTFPMKGVAKLYLDYWEVPLLKKGFEVINEIEGTAIPYQIEHVARGTEINVLVDLVGKGELNFLIKSSIGNQEIKQRTYRLHAADGVRDIKPIKEVSQHGVYINNHSIETPFVRISWKENEGLISWFDKRMNRELFREDRLYNAFTPIYEITPNPKKQHVGVHRNNMGRNRKGMNVIRNLGRLINVREISKGCLFSKVELVYELSGTRYFSVVLTVFSDLPRVDVAVRLNKENIWEPENLYIALPFIVGDPESMETWIEKTGIILRPRKDQLPGTGTDFYCIQEGIAYVAEKSGLAIAMPDTPLIQLGSLEHKEIVLHDKNQKIEDGEHLYSWVMNNFWETNFKATLGGFYEFNYSVYWGEEIKDPTAAIQQCHSMNVGPICIRSCRLSGGLVNEKRH